MRVGCWGDQHTTRAATQRYALVCAVFLSLSFSPYSHITKRRLRAARCVSESLGRFTGAVVAFFATLSDRSSPLLSALEGFPSPSVEPYEPSPVEDPRIDRDDPEDHRAAEFLSFSPMPQQCSSCSHTHAV